MDQNVRKALEERGYTIIGMLSEEGGMSDAVYSAIEDVAGQQRKVAIKVIRQTYDLTNVPNQNQEMLRKYLHHEAGMIAAINHPRIIELLDYDYVSEESFAFLVSRYMEGGTLKDVLKQASGNPLPTSLVMRWLGHITDALSYLAELGIVHRDLKPGNILLDSHQNAYVADFGIARVLDAINNSSPVSGISSPHSPLYAAPEQKNPQLGIPVTVAPDIFSLGLLAFELFVGTTVFSKLMRTAEEGVVLPSVREVQPDLPTEIDDILRKATATHPHDRYAHVGDFMEALHSALRLTDGFEATVLLGRTVKPHDVENPYRALEAFTEAHHDLFFGRTALIEEVLQQFERTTSGGRFLALVGPSGSGKSSVIRAGVIPKLKHDRLPNSGQWCYLYMTPGDNPFYELDAVLMKSEQLIKPANQLSVFDLLQHPDGLTRALKLLLPQDAKTEVVMVIDQFEELWSIVRDEELRRRFLSLLAGALNAYKSRFNLIITLRGDFMDRAQSDSVWSPIMDNKIVYVKPFTQDELREAILGPAVKARIRFEPGLVETIVGAVESRPGTLPLLSHLLWTLYQQDCQKGNTLTRQTYHELGGVGGALNKLADEAYDRLDEVRQRLVRQIFLRLVNIEDGVEPTRRRILKTEAEAVREPMVLSATVQDVIERFLLNRLLTLGSDADRQPTVELAHETVLRWPRFENWIEQSRIDAPMRDRLRTLTQDWQQAQEAGGYLLSMEQVINFEKHMAQTDLAVTPQERTLIAKSRALRQREEDERARQIEKLNKATKRAARIRASLFAATSLFLVVLAVVMTAFFLFQREQYYKSLLYPGGIVIEGGVAQQVRDSIDRLHTNREGLPDVAVQTLNEAQIEMVRVPAGCFYMGSIVSIDSQALDDTQSPIAMRCLDEFWIDRYEVTQGQYTEVKGAPWNYSFFVLGGNNRPVESIPWDEAQEYCAIRGGRLPNEAEWEYAARGPESRSLPHSDAAGRWDENVVVFGSNSATEQDSFGETRDVIDIAGNPLRPGGASWVGAYDMAGNVAEWTLTIYDQTRFPYPYVVGDGRDSLTPDQSIERVTRGGAYDSNSDQLSTAYRQPFSGQESTIGFRCVRETTP
jgi:serine/threonine protein kinase/formylglycine-generating enzyme required for sulfatase activity